MEKGNAYCLIFVTYSELKNREKKNISQVNISEKWSKNPAESQALDFWKFNQIATLFEPVSFFICSPILSFVLFSASQPFQNQHINLYMLIIDSSRNQQSHNIFSDMRECQVDTSKIMTTCGPHSMKVEIDECIFLPDEPVLSFRSGKCQSTYANGTHSITGPVSNLLILPKS